MNKNEITLRKLKGIVIPDGQEDNKSHVASLMTNIMSLGFVFSENAFNDLARCSVKEINSFADDLVRTLTKLKGADVSYKPMYPNFPQQVLDASHFELYMNAFIHYWTFGHWMPEYREEARGFALENVDFIQIQPLSDETYHRIFTNILASNDSVSELDSLIIKYFMMNEPKQIFPENIPHKENMCYVAGLFFDQGKDVSKILRTATDVLRMVTYLSDGDISLSENTKFKSLPKATRRRICRVLEDVTREEDIARYRETWKRLFHNLHVGEHSKYLYDVAAKVRNNERIVTFNGAVEEALLVGNVQHAMDLLKDRPGEFARRLNELLGMQHTTKMIPKSANTQDVQAQWKIVDGFQKVIDNVPTRVLAQLRGHLQTRYMPVEKRVVYPKGNVQRAMVINSPLPALDVGILTALENTITDSLISRFKKLPPLGKVWIDPQLSECPLPTQQRSATDALFTVARGTRMLIGDDSTIRLFIYWKGLDIDLSATFYKDDFEPGIRISYTNLKADGIRSCHSGDIIRAPNGACEFIDINIEDALNAGYRYVMQNVLVYTGPNFKDHEICYAGWMIRNKPNKNAVFDPKTVKQKVDLRSNARHSTPVIFDLKTRKAIWADVNIERLGTYRGGRNVESNVASLNEILEAIVTTAERKMSLCDLFTHHAWARGQLVSDREDADLVFAWDGDVTPYDINVINAEYMA